MALRAVPLLAAGSPACPGAPLSGQVARKQNLLFQTGENNPQAIKDLRSHLDLCAKNNRQVILGELIEKRYAQRPCGWPEEEVLLLIARLLVLTEIQLVMDGGIVPLEKVYDAITTPSKRKKIVLLKRQASDPKVIQDARGLGKELFVEMGPDGEDGVFTRGS